MFITTFSVFFIIHIKHDLVYLFYCFIVLSWWCDIILSILSIVSHGILFIFHSGLWMILASSGVPHLAAKGLLSRFPPSVPPFLQCDAFMCKKIHRVDLVFGHIFLFLGAFWLGDGSNHRSPQILATKGTAILAWVFSISYKIYIHTNYKTHNKFTTAEKKSN